MKLLRGIADYRMKPFFEILSVTRCYDGFALTQVSGPALWKMRFDNAHPLGAPTHWAIGSKEKPLMIYPSPAADMRITVRYAPALKEC